MDTEYQLFICDISQKHEPICIFVSTTPFPSFAKGQRFDDHGWQRLDGTVQGSQEMPLRYTIHSIKHVIQLVDNKNICQIGLNLEPHFGERSPAFTTDVTLSWSEAMEIYKINAVK